MDERGTAASIRPQPGDKGDPKRIKVICRQKGAFHLQISAFAWNRQAGQQKWWLSSGIENNRKSAVALPLKQGNKQTS
jgi:hypothetical protein